ncbi:MAG: rhodanese-like domain-containing protein [Bacteroidales bacterium]
MEELNKTNRLTIVVVAFVLIIIVGLITIKKPDVKYKLNNSESLALLRDTLLTINPIQANALLKDSSGKTTFIDVRNSIAFEKSHVKNAINIPVRELFSSKSKTILLDLEKAGQTAILYGETQQQANGPWFMLCQTGYKNVKLFTGNYAQFNLNPDSITRSLPQFSETPLIDTLALKALSAPLSSTQTETKAKESTKKKVAPVKKEASSGGGC